MRRHPPCGWRFTILVNGHGVPARHLSGAIIIHRPLTLKTLRTQREKIWDRFASLNTKWTYPLFIQPGIVFVCLTFSVNQAPIDLNPSVLVFRLTCAVPCPRIFFLVRVCIKCSSRGLIMMTRTHHEERGLIMRMSRGLIIRREDS